MEEIGTDELTPGGREAVRELLAELQTPRRASGRSSSAVRETVETLVYGD